MEDRQTSPGLVRRGTLAGRAAANPACRRSSGAEPARASDRLTRVHRVVLVVLFALGAVACVAPPAGQLFALTGRALAGPTCPVQPASPAPGQCAPRAVGNAILLVTDPQGHEVGRITTQADGSFSGNLPAGTYTLTPQRVPGLLGVAPPVTFTVSATGRPVDLRVEYDTGIR